MPVYQPSVHCCPVLQHILSLTWSGYGFLEFSTGDQTGWKWKLAGNQIAPSSHNGYFGARVSSSWLCWNLQQLRIRIKWIHQTVTGDSGVKVLKPRRQSPSDPLMLHLHREDFNQKPHNSIFISVLCLIRRWPLVRLPDLFSDSLHNIFVAVKSVLPSSEINTFISRINWRLLYALYQKRTLQ